MSDEEVVEVFKLFHQPRNMHSIGAEIPIAIFKKSQWRWKYLKKLIKDAYPEARDVKFFKDEDNETYLVWIRFSKERTSLSSVRRFATHLRSLIEEIDVINSTTLTGNAPEQLVKLFA